MALMSEALTPVHLPKPKDGKRPAKVRRLPRSVLEGIAAGQADKGTQGGIQP